MERHAYTQHAKRVSGLEPGHTLTGRRHAKPHQEPPPKEQHATLGCTAQRPCKIMSTKGGRIWFRSARWAQFRRSQARTESDHRLGTTTKESLDSSMPPHGPMEDLSKHLRTQLKQSTLPARMWRPGDAAQPPHNQASPFTDPQGTPPPPRARGLPPQLPPPAAPP